jgi:ankyrin repeat protein
LIDQGADVNGQTRAGDTPLHYAAFMGYTKCVKLLLERGAVLEMRGQCACTPLHMAAREGSIQNFSILRSRRTSRSDEGLITMGSQSEAEG